MEVVITKGRYIEIPEYIMKKLGLKIGERVTIKEKSDKKKIDEIIKADVWEFQ